MSDLDDLAELVDRPPRVMKRTIKGSAKGFATARRHAHEKRAGFSGYGHKNRSQPSLPKLKCLEGDDA